MTEQIPAPVEPAKTPEALLENSHYRAVHGRFLLGGLSLNPDKTDLAVVTKESLGSFDSRNYDSFTSASTNERKQTALVEKGKLGEAVDVWSADTARVLNQDFSKKNGFDQVKADRWKQSLAKIIGTDPATVSADQVKGLFQKYFSGEGNASNIKLFITDVLKAYNNDLTAVEANLDCVQWLANIFGGQSSTMVRELVTAESLLVNKPDELINELNQAGEDKITRINNVNSDEKRLLEFVWSGKEYVIIPPVVGKKDETPPVVNSEKDNYLKARDQYITKFSDPALIATQLNEQYLKLAEVKPLTEEELTKIRSNPDAMRQLVRTFMVNTEVKNRLLQQMMREDPQILSSKEKSLEYVQARQGEIKKMRDDLNAEIDKWEEKEEEKPEEPEEKVPATEEPAAEQEPASAEDAAEKKKKKKNPIARLIDRLRKKRLNCKKVRL